MEINYPLSIILTWNPSISSFNTLKEVCDSLKELSCYYGIQWEVTATIKTFKTNPQLQQLQSQSQGQSQGQQIDKKKVKEQRTGVIFIQYDDSNTTCVINSKDLNNLSYEDIIIADENIENLLTGFAGLSLRATRKIQGFRYNLGDYIVSIGTMNHGTLAGITILELSYIGSELDSNTVISELHSLAESLIPSNDRNSLNLNLKSFVGEINSERSFSFADRVLLWINSLQLLQP